MQNRHSHVSPLHVEHLRIATQKSASLTAKVHETSSYTQPAYTAGQTLWAERHYLSSGKSEDGIWWKYYCLIKFSNQAGGFAGTATDVLTFPLDTIKTRLQSSTGFLKGGGWKGLYRYVRTFTLDVLVFSYLYVPVFRSGLGPVFIGSAPQAAIFFVCYDSIKKVGKVGLMECR